MESAENVKMGNSENVKKLYSIFHAGWYNPFRKVWSRVSRKVEVGLIEDIKSHGGADMMILELGCGTGVNLGRLVFEGVLFKQYLGLDFTQSMLDVAKESYSDVENAEFRQHDLTEKPVEGKYDFILCTWVLSHIPDSSKVVNAYLKILKKSGVMHLIFLTRPKWYVNFWMYPICRLFSVTYVPDSEVQKMGKKREINKYLAGFMTHVQVKN